MFIADQEDWQFVVGPAAWALSMPAKSLLILLHGLCMGGALCFTPIITMQMVIRNTGLSLIAMSPALVQYYSKIVLISDCP